jgi:hypothetical protein
MIQIDEFEDELQLVRVMLREDVSGVEVEIYDNEEHRGIWYHWMTLFYSIDSDGQVKPMFASEMYRPLTDAAYERIANVVKRYWDVRLFL